MSGKYLGNISVKAYVLLFFLITCLSEHPVTWAALEPRLLANCWPCWFKAYARQQTCPGATNPVSGAAKLQIIMVSDGPDSFGWRFDVRKNP